jgi:hypothetical protein
MYFTNSLAQAARRSRFEVSYRTLDAEQNNPN